MVFSKDFSIIESGTVERFDVKGNSRGIDKFGSGGMLKYKLLEQVPPHLTKVEQLRDTDKGVYTGYINKNN